jgi:hypothetical protein
MACHGCAKRKEALLKMARAVRDAPKTAIAKIRERLAARGSK